MPSFNGLETSNEYDDDYPDEERRESLPLMILNRKQEPNEDNPGAHHLHLKQAQMWQLNQPFRLTKKLEDSSLTASLSLINVRSRRLIACGVVTLCALYGLSTSIKSSIGSFADGSETQAKQSTFVPLEYSPVPLLFPTPTNRSRHDDQLYSIGRIRQAFNGARDELLKTLEVQYGSVYLQQMLQSAALKSPSVSAPASAKKAGSSASSSGAAADSDAGLGWERMRRKIAVKLLSIQLRVYGRDAAASPRDAMRMESFVWATGGHSGK
jgi:hypothetical protein